MRLIDADALAAELLKYPLILRHHGDFVAVNLDAVLAEIRRAPTIDPESLRPQGECKFCEDYDRMMGIVCYLPNGNGGATDLPVNYCPNCGAKMKGADDHA